ncbi:MAG: hypothetical protein EOM20_00295 [Spartobacteria bacterium]|nr:hypothetical protein [Spartobacteria bacterium]
MMSIIEATTQGRSKLDARKRTHKVLKCVGRVFVYQFMAALISALCAGCATTGYLGDRMRDAGDMATMTVGMGAGAKGRVGPVQVGLVVNRDLAGVRAGTVSIPWSLDTDFLLFPLYGFGFEWMETTNQVVIARHKCVNTSKPLPFLSLVDTGEKFEHEWSFSREHLHYYTGIDIVIGLGGTLRFGINPGEIIDFILGWMTIDIFNDDLQRTKP